MTIHFDEKGKYFTNIISKIPVLAKIQTLTHQIHGTIHVRQGERVKDTLNGGEPFLAVTQAQIFAPDGQLIDESEFIALNRRHIIWVVPQEEPYETREGELHEPAA